MKISLIPSDGFAIVDGVARQISFAGIDPTIHAVQFDTVALLGAVEIAQLAPDGSRFTIPTAIPSLAAFQAAFQVYVDRWTAAAPIVSATPVPNVQGFIAALAAAVGGSVAWNTFMTKYPAIYIALQSGDWQTVHDLIVAANAVVAVTPAQYAGIKTLISTYNIPVPALP